MKRKLALLILMILSLTVVLVACGNTVKTEIALRWESESYTFNISLADFAPDDSEDVFKTEKHENKIYVKDMEISGEVFSGSRAVHLDEIRPIDVAGTYQLNIIKSDSASNWKMVTKQTIFAKYSKSVVTLSEEELQSILPDSQDEIGITAGENDVILKSVTETEVLFEVNNKQTPISSKTSVNGFYVGNKHQEVTSYTVETTYDYSESRPKAKTVKKTAEGEETLEFKFAKNATFIDSNQILLYVRSLDKSGAKFPDNPSVMVFNPYSQETANATFLLSHDNNMILTRTVDKDGKTTTENAYTNLSVVSVLIGGIAFMQQQNIPDTLKNVDMIIDKPKYTTVRFRVGHLAYEFATYSDELWNAFNNVGEAEK